MLSRVHHLVELAVVKGPSIPFRSGSFQESVLVLLHCNSFQVIIQVVLHLQEDRMEVLFEYSILNSKLRWANAGGLWPFYDMIHSHLEF